MRPSLWVFALFIGFVALLVAASAAIALSFRQDQVSVEVRHARDVDRQLIVIERAVTDAEASQRGFLLTGRNEYLRPYDEARHALPADLVAMRSLVAGSSDAAATFAQLNHLIEQKLDELQTTVALQSSGRGEDALAIVNNDSGRRLMEEVRLVSDRLSSSIRSDVEVRRAHLETLSLSTRWALSLSVLLVLLLGGAVTFDVRRRMRAIAESNARLLVERDSREAAEMQVQQLQRMEAIGQLTGGIAHDFNNMLAVIMGSIEMSQRRIDPDSDARVWSNLKIAAEAARRAADLTARLLAFSRRQPLDPKVVDVSKLVGGMSEMLHRTLDASIDIQTVFAGGLWRTFVDAGQLESALLNLAVNARDAMPGGGKLTIEAGNAELDDRYAAAHAEVVPGQYVMISVSDNGSGMSLDVAARAFEPFYSTKGSGKGTGLGLSQVYGFVKQSGGHIKIYSELGQGTTVKVYLPRYFGTAEHEISEPSATLPPQRFAGAVILLVEDDVSVLDVSSQALRELGYVVLPTVSPRDALRIVEQRSDIAMLFTDVVMPEMNGRELAERALAMCPGLKVLYTSGYTRNAIVHNGVVDPGTSLLPKPFTISQLAARVEGILGG